MYEAFHAHFALDAPAHETCVRVCRMLDKVEGFQELMDSYSGRSFSQGLYRLHDLKSGIIADRLVEEGFPGFGARICCFGFDWMGCQFALDRNRSTDDQPLVLMFEPATGQVFEVDRTFKSFHEIELISDTDHALAKQGFDEWTQAFPYTLPLKQEQCVGHKVPLFLGGQDSIDNMEIVDIEVYWSLTSQIRRAIHPPSIHEK